MKEKLVYLDYIQRSYKKKKEILIKDSSLTTIDSKKAKQYCLELECNYITIYCKEYPDSLKLLPNPPLVIYYIGDINLINKKQIAIIGSRNNTQYGKAYVEYICTKIQGYAITSGYAYGIDQLAHINALKNNLKTVAVLGGGFAHIYPKNNKKLLREIKNNNLLISEYPPTVTPKPWNFLMRNRIIAALSQKILVIEANVKSGSLKTVEVALEQSKEIYALPGSVYSEQSIGTNLLIEEGANILNKDSTFTN